MENNQIKIRQPFSHRENYGIFNDLIDNNGFMMIRTTDINKFTYDQYFKWLVNFMVDGIETDIWHGKGKIKVIFDDNVDCNLTINDFMFNFILWYMPVQIEKPITSKLLFWEKNITNNTIAKYINRTFISKTRGIYTNTYMNNIIADCTGMMAIIDKISKYLSDSINFYDDVQLMKRCPEYFDCLHLDVSRQPIDRVSQVINETIEDAVNIITDSKKYLGYYHSLASNFMTGEALNKKQFGETYIAIGTKPDPHGGVFPRIISKSFINGGVTDNVDRFIESTGGRQAAIISHKNVSDSGSFAKKLGLNNQNSFLHRDPHYSCKTRNLMKVYIDNIDTLMRLDLRYYKLTPNGVKMKLRFSDTHLIGKYIYLYSPMTCASYASGHGICYQCYGDLAFVNSNINIGIFGANELSNEFTQRMLSAKHILETIITVIKWLEGFDEYFSVETDQMMFNSEKVSSGVKIIFRIDDIQEDDDELDSDDDDDKSITDDISSKFYLTEFTIYDPKEDKTVLITSEDSNKMYFTKELYKIVERAMRKSDDIIELDVSTIDLNMFNIDIDNSGLNRTLNAIKNLIDKVAVTSRLTKEELLQKFIESLNDAKIKMNSVHSEVLMANQIRDKNDILNKPAWEYDNVEYTITSLRQSLSANPSLIISLAYQDVANQLNANTLTSRKHAPSIYDLNVMKYPQQFFETIDIEKAKDDTSYEMSVLGVSDEIDNIPKLIDPIVVLSKDK